jgi:hypothetical protein
MKVDDPASRAIRKLCVRGSTNRRGEFQFLIDNKHKRESPDEADCRENLDNRRRQGNPVLICPEVVFLLYGDSDGRLRLRRTAGAGDGDGVGAGGCSGLVQCGVTSAPARRYGYKREQQQSEQCLPFAPAQG